VVLGSLRARLLVWYTAMLAVVILAFGSIVCYLAWRAKLADVDAALRTRAETLIAGLQPASAGTFDLKLPADAVRGSADALYHVLWTPLGVVIDRSDSDLEVPRPDRPGIHTRDRQRELTVMASGAYVLVGTSLEGLRTEIAGLAVTMASVGVLALALAFVGGWYLVGRALTPVARINRTARAMVDGDFQARVPIDRIETELGQLARALNEAFDRLHAALERQRRFTADASHELRTPLAVISTETQWALGRDRRPEDYRQALDACARASTRMRIVVERLLALARAEALPEPGCVEPVRLDELVLEVVKDLRSLGHAKGVDFSVAAAPIECRGDRDRLRDAVTNVVANAIQYNVEGGQVRIDVRAGADCAEIVVADTGIGISADHLPQVFEPFFRADPARTRAAGGSGLGLGVTRATIRQHGGDVLCASEPGRGTTVTIRLPRAPARLDASSLPDQRQHHRTDQRQIITPTRDSSVAPASDSDRAPTATAELHQPQ
jgi:signal transduction histidine kinase